jgi:hypothetical protein
MRERKMFGKSCLIAIIFIPLSYAYAAGGTGSIGTVSARGNMRVDGYTVSGNGTLFDGTNVETGQASATLRLDSGTEITLSTNSQGVVYSNHLVLLQGKSQLKTSSDSFLLEAEGLHVASGAPNTLGVVALGPEKTVEVAAVTGELRIVNNAGLSLARVSTGAAFSFPAAQQQQPPAAAGEGQTLKEIEGVEVNENGNYYVTDIDGTKYELVTGNNLKKFVGKNVAIAGFVQASSTEPGTTQIIVTAIGLNGSGSTKAGAGSGGGGSKGVLIGVAVAGGAAAVIGIALSEGSKTPASP